MARYEVTAPDGAKYNVTAPDSASQADVLALAAAGRKAGPHGPSNKALRRRARMALKRGED